jgi:translation initiation factor 2B subunit (eIF-2B alpha/beta/delta family)
MKRPRGWLNEQDEANVMKMEQVVKAQWEKGADASEFTPHDPDHFARVEDWIRALIPQERWKDFSFEERKILTWCAWTHDIGMLTSHYSKDESSKTIRNKHVEQSATWVANEWASLKLDRMEAQVIADIIRFHSRSNSLEDCPSRRSCMRTVVRPRLLAAYLRLADALDVAHDRVQEPHRFNLLLRQVAEDIDDTLFHWVKSFVVSGIALDYDHHEIRVEFMNHTGANQQHFAMIKRYVLDEIEDELASVEQTMSFGGISSFHLVTSHVGGHIRGDLQAKVSTSIDRVLTWVQLTRSPNSTAITVAALRAVRALLDEVKELRKKAPSEAWHALRTGLRRLLNTLGEQRRKRRCHNELRRIFEFLNQIYQDNEFKEDFDEAIFQGLEAFTEQFLRFAIPDKQRYSLLAKELAKVLDGLNPGRSLAGPWTFLLYGCSDTVASVLSAFNVDRRIRLCIAEGRSKTHYGPHNIPTYVDAEAYAERLCLCGVKAEQTNIIPDACIASTIHMGHVGLLAPIDAVIFGTNGIYIDPEILVAHTAGHLTCAISARHYSTPVVVLGSSTKILQFSEKGEARTSRDSKWYASDKEALERLRKYGADTSWNPREDRVPFELIDVIITDQGIVQRKDGSEAAKSELMGQLQRVDNLLRRPSVFGAAGK